MLTQQGFQICTGDRVTCLKDFSLFSSVSMKFPKQHTEESCRPCWRQVTEFQLLAITAFFAKLPSPSETVAKYPKCIIKQATTTSFRIIPYLLFTQHPIIQGYRSLYQTPTV